MSINYTRVDDNKGWRNKQTALSATNLNHMDTGILKACDGVDDLSEKYNALDEVVEGEASGLVTKVENLEDAVTGLNVVVEGHTSKINSYDEEIETLTTNVEAAADAAAIAIESARVANEGLQEKQDILVSGVDIKKINGMDILGGGNIIIEAGDKPTAFEELDSADINQMTDRGIYKITNALNNPIETSANGLLRVTELDNGAVQQEWMSENNHAIRLLNEEVESLHFYVTYEDNTREEVSQGTVYLPAGYTYELSGDLLGRIEIGEEGQEVANRTKIILNGVNIQSDANYAIAYWPNSSKLVVEIKDSSKNYLLVAAAITLDEFAALYSENNLLINGIGYLTIKTNTGHGIKASELIINGNPHMYLDVAHDAIHGGKLLKITGGYFEVENANDAFSASAGGSNDGKLLILGGEYVIHNCVEAAFEGKSANGVKRIINSKITFGEGVNKLVNASNASDPKFTVKIFEENEIINNSGKELPALANFGTEIGAPRVLLDGETVEASGDTFILQGFPKKERENRYRIEGNFSGYKIVTESGAGDYIDINVGDIYYKDSVETDPFISHTPTDARIKLKTTENKLIYIEKANGTIIQSGKGIQITSKGDVIIDGCGTADCGLSAPTSYALLSGDGLRNIKGCAIGIYADNIRLGEDPEDIADGKYSVSDDPIYLFENDLDAKITNQGSQPDFNGKIIATQYHGGLTILGSAEAEEGANISIDAQEGNVLADSTYFNKAILYTNAEVTKEGTYEYIAPEGVEKEIPSLDNSSVWIVYKGAYTKEEIDEKFVTKQAYNALLEELDNRAPKKINIINYVKRSDDDPRPAKTGAYANGKIDEIQIFKYACPDRLDADTSFKKGAWERKAETHGDYIKDGRPMYARNGDFGYPEIDTTGQFNFRPIFNTNGYILTPIITKEDGTPAEAGVDYNNFKSPYCTGIEGTYRITKINKNLNIDMEAALEAEMPKHTVTYRIVMPEVYSGARPNIRVFRCEDQLEKYVVYGSYQANPKDSKELALGTELVDGKVLTFNQIESTKEGFVMYEAIDCTYDDMTGFPAKPLTRDDAVKVNFIVEGEPHTPYVVADEKVLVAAATGEHCDKLNPANEYAGMHVTKVYSDINITITIDDPFDVEYTWVNPEAADKYEFVPKAESRTYKIAPEVGFMWGIKHNAGISDDDPRRVEDSAEAKEFAFSYIDNITVGGTPINITEAFEKVVVKKNEFNLTFKGSVITGDIIITVKDK